MSIIGSEASMKSISCLIQVFSYAYKPFEFSLIHICRRRTEIFVFDNLCVFKRLSNCKYMCSVLREVIEFRVLKIKIGCFVDISFEKKLYSPNFYPNLF